MMLGTFYDSVQCLLIRYCIDPWVFSGSSAHGENNVGAEHAW